MNTLSRIALTGCVALLAACGSESVGDAIGISEPQIRLAHAAPNAPAVTLDRDGVAASQASALSYPTVSDYFTISTGSANWGVKVAATGTSIGSVAINADSGHRYTLVAVADSLTSTSLVTIDDPSNRSLTSDDARLRLVNASALTQRIDVYLTGVDQDIATLTPDFPNVDFKAASPASGTNALERRGVTYKATVTAAGSKTALFQGTLAVPEDSDVLLIAVPAIEGSVGVRLLAKVQGQPGAVAVPAR